MVIQTLSGVGLEVRTYVESECVGTVHAGHNAIRYGCQIVYRMDPSGCQISLRKVDGTYLSQKSPVSNAPGLNRLEPHTISPDKLHEIVEYRNVISCPLGVRLVDGEEEYEGIVSKQCFPCYGYSC